MTVWKLLHCRIKDITQPTLEVDAYTYNIIVLSFLYDGALLSKKRWCVERRYSEFSTYVDNLYDQNYDFVPPLPSKDWFITQDHVSREKRRSKLEVFLMKIVDRQDILSSKLTEDFLNLYNTEPTCESYLKTQNVISHAFLELRCADVISPTDDSSDYSYITIHQRSDSMQMATSVIDAYDPDHMSVINLGSVNRLHLWPYETNTLRYSRLPIAEYGLSKIARQIVTVHTDGGAHFSYISNNNDFIGNLDNLKLELHFGPPISSYMDLTHFLSVGSDLSVRIVDCLFNKVICGGKLHSNRIGNGSVQCCYLNQAWGHFILASTTGYLLLFHYQNLFNPQQVASTKLEKAVKSVTIFKNLILAFCKHDIHYFDLNMNPVGVSKLPEYGSITFNKTLVNIEQEYVLAFNVWAMLVISLSPKYVGKVSMIKKIANEQVLDVNWIDCETIVVATSDGLQKHISVKYTKENNYLPIPRFLSDLSKHISVYHTYDSIDYKFEENSFDVVLPWTRSNLDSYFRDYKLEKDTVLKSVETREQMTANFKNGRTELKKINQTRRVA